ncbi:hypothetical protein Pint_03807 [Pistacia integerrima]|uniref:Uncharacterized protein n=1 Tax=Pistacia integerrima TaxID=434235 RepID=A0ACC0Z3Z7_9ROSI|nr:hypothetical protein Pint_03807 [Pistacia integerrima]
MAHQEAIKQLQSLIEDVEDESMKETFKNMHQDKQTETLVRFLKARDWNVSKAHKMRPIIPAELYRAVRDSQLIGLSGYSKDGLPVIAVGVGLSTYDKASANYYLQSHIQINEYRDRVVLPAASKKYDRHIGTCLKILDMTGLKLSALNQIKLMTAISTVDDLNYPEKAETYYIVNAPYIFSACFKPENVLVREDGHIMLSDFGLSLRCAVSLTVVKSSTLGSETLKKNPKVQKPKNETGNQVTPLPELIADPTNARSMSFVGTHEYLAPETIEGEGHGNAVDWWNFGIFLYELSFGGAGVQNVAVSENYGNVGEDSIEDFKRL